MWNLTGEFYLAALRRRRAARLSQARPGLASSQRRRTGPTGGQGQQQATAPFAGYGSGSGGLKAVSWLRAGGSMPALRSSYVGLPPR